LAMAGKDVAHLDSIMGTLSLKKSIH